MLSQSRPPFRAVRCSTRARQAQLEKIRKAAQAGDAHALAAWNKFHRDLAIGLANVIAFVNPEKIAIGGGVSTR